MWIKIPVIVLKLWDLRGFIHNAEEAPVVSVITKSSCSVNQRGLRGATIVDSLDTLYIMGLTEDYKEAKEWIRTSLDLDLDSFQIKHSPKGCLVQLLTALLLSLGFSRKREGARLEKDIARMQTNPIIMDAETGRWRKN
ncbi:mannosyl-oligosaccharide 1,2-alpha-mannosidase IA isoform X1 [Tachysurus ichikawai]